MEPGGAAEGGDDRGVETACADGGVADVDDGVPGPVEIRDSGSRGDGFAGADLAGEDA